MDTVRLNECIEKCISNNKEFIPFKTLFEDALKSFIIKFNEYNLEPDYDNFYSRLSNLKVSYSNDIDSLSSYKSDSNILEINTDKVKAVTDESALDRMFNESILDIFTYVYNIENDGFNKGVTFDFEGKKMGKVINEKISDRILEVFFGHDDEILDNKMISLPTAKEQLYYDIVEIIGSDRLFTYYLNGRGDLFLSKMSEYFSTEEECIDFISSTDKLDDSIVNDNIYYSKVETAINNKKENINAQTL